MWRSGFILLFTATCALADAALQVDDRVLFVGDDLTQQMFYSRAAATALMSIQPADRLHFYNGGREGATAQDAVGWIDELLTLTDPTVVVLAFGLADAEKNDADTFATGLTNLVSAVRQHPQVREVVVLSPPALPKDTGPKLAELAEVAAAVARTESTTFIDIYQPMRRLYDTAEPELAGELSLGGRLAGEAMHVVIASYWLAAIGVDGAEIERVGWSPLAPQSMGRVRPHLAWGVTSAPSQAAAALSRELYLEIGRHDELFFRLWRLPQEQSPQALGEQLAEAWAAVENRASACLRGAGAEQ